ncbi:MAG: LysE family translocator [Cyanobacteria bacterium P01_H01_bin.21]
MSPTSTMALFATMFLLAVVPGPSVFAVVARSMASGFYHGVVTAVGIVIGDVVFIFLAILGLWTLAETSAFFWVKYLGSAYLIYVGVATLRSKPRQQPIEGIRELSWLSNFTCGLLITLSDSKAIVFYAGFLPAYVDLSDISVTDMTAILLSAAIAVGGAKLLYAYLADKTRGLLRNNRVQTVINGLASSTMIATGLFLAINT